MSPLPPGRYHNNTGAVTPEVSHDITLQLLLHIIEGCHWHCLRRLACRLSLRYAMLAWLAGHTITPHQKTAAAGYVPSLVRRYHCRQEWLLRYRQPEGFHVIPLVLH